MDISLKLGKNFTTQFNRLCGKYGEEFERLQGIDKDRLSFTDFIDHFIDSQNVADVSIDANSNIAQKDIVNLIEEMTKPHKKMLAFNKIYYEINKNYSFKEANRISELIWNYSLYLHDFDTSTFYPYCHAYDIKDIVERGLFFIDGYHATPPKHLDSFIQILMEAIAFLSRRQSGAVGLPNLIPYLFWFWKKDVDNNYGGDPERYKNQQIEALIYRLNQPWVRSAQASFTNVSVFDHPYFEALFGGAEFPDGTFMIDHEEEIIQFQKDFINVVNKIREVNVFTFPVLTSSLLYQNGKFVDEEFAKWSCEASIKWNIFNFFIDDSVNSLSNCPLASNTNIVYWSDRLNSYKLSSIKDVYDNRSRDNKIPIVKVLSNGQEINCKINKFDIAPEYEITLVNGAKIQTTADHLNKVYGKDYVPTKELTVEDYLPYGKHGYEKSDCLTYEEGKIVGAFLGDGSYTDYGIVLSLNRETDRDFMDWLKDYVPKYFGGECSEHECISQISGLGNCVNFTIKSLYLRGLISQCVVGSNALNKEINLRVLNYSKHFREGIIDGWCQTDGGNNNRIYTSSKRLVDTMNVVFASLGMITRVDEDNREGRLGSNPCYTVRYYTPGNRKTLKDVYKIDDDYMWIKIKSIARIKNNRMTTSYCLEVLDPVEPIFMLGNGVITHNCRLKSDIRGLGYFNSIGGTALRVGSVKVATLNLARLAYTSTSEEEFIDNLIPLLDADMKLLHIIRGIIKRNVEKGLLPNFSSGLLHFENLYNSIGINGIFETMKTFGYTYIDKFGNTFYKDEAYAFGEKIFNTIRQEIEKFLVDKDYKINIEQVPAEQAAIKLQKADTLLYPEKVVKDLPLYGNQWIPLAIKATIAERTKICAAFDRFCNGGSIEHINLDAPFSNFEQAWHMLNWVAQQGITYFAFNGKVSQCEDFHSFYGDICPICGKPKALEYTRTVGFYTPTYTWSKERREEGEMREWLEINKKGEGA